jgi:hypothetical protein
MIELKVLRVIAVGRSSIGLLVKTIGSFWWREGAIGFFGELAIVGKIFHFLELFDLVVCHRVMGIVSTETMIF